jgi:hypothetical protein
VQALAGRVGDIAKCDIELGRPALRGVMMQRQVADDSVPLAREPDRQLLGDIDRSVGVNGEERIEVPDADAAVGVLRARAGGE